MTTVSFSLDFISLVIAEASSGTGPENVLKDDNSIWHSKNRILDPIPFISLKMEEEEEVFMVKVVDSLGKGPFNTSWASWP